MCCILIGIWCVVYGMDNIKIINYSLLICFYKINYVLYFFLYTILLGKKNRSIPLLQYILPYVANN